MNKDARPNDGGPAFPASRSHFNEDGQLSSADWITGMTLRDYFAAHAVAFWARANIGGWVGQFPADRALVIAEHCYIIADAMLIARAEAPAAGVEGKE